MKILAIESSCDETGAAVVEKTDSNHIRVLSNVTASSIALHAATGGIIPEAAAREQVKWIMPVIVQALLQSEAGGAERQDPLDWRRTNEILRQDVDAIAVTHGPGLVGSLLVGVETAKALSFALGKPIIPVNHLLAHLFANFITINNQQSTINFPFIGLIVSGGHTDLLYFKSVNDFTWLGGTRDDAAGEALDKIGRLLNLPYPAGPEIEKRALQFTHSHSRSVNEATPRVITFHSPLLHEDTFDFSFSGLKTEVMRFINSATGPRALDERLVNQICFAVQKAIFDVLVDKTLKAAEKYQCQTILLGGGVSANETLLEQLKLDTRRYKLNAQIFAPQKSFATDNAAMIGGYAALNFQPTDWHEITADPELYFD